MPRTAVLSILLISAIALAGCLDGTPLSGDACPEPVVSLFHGQTSQGATPRAPSQPVTVLAWITNPAEATADVAVRTDASDAASLEGLQPDASRHHGIHHTLAPKATGFAFFEIDVPAEDDDLGVTGSLGPSDGAEGALACQETSIRSSSLDLAEPRSGDPVEVGKGVLVHTAGVWTNGTSFYTNLDRFHQRGDLPKAYLGDYGGGDPLKVYVYDESPDEMPRRYEEAGYAATIPGFNDALKGMTTTAPRTTYLTPEEAYTREDRRDHPLYGDALVFYIEVVEVVEEPCTVPEPVCDIPQEPDVPPDRLGLALDP